MAQITTAIRRLLRELNNAERNLLGVRATPSK